MHKPKTLSLYNRLSRNPQVHTLMMSRDESSRYFDEDAEVVFAGFEHSQLNLIAVIDVSTEKVQLYIL